MQNAQTKPSATREDQPPIQLAIAGATGRMGQALIRLIKDDPLYRLACAWGHVGSPHLNNDIGLINGLGPLDIFVTAEPYDGLDRLDAIIDFSTPQSTIKLSKIAAHYELVHIVGTTGLSEQDYAQLRQSAESARIVQSGNMSLGINLLSILVEKAATMLGPDFDINIVEMHHRYKVDAPSGTALMLGQAAAAGRQGKTSIDYASLRGGTVIGEHSVIFAGPSERVELSHHAESRDIFARGALTAARWAIDKKPGLYTMVDILKTEMETR